MSESGKVSLVKSNSDEDREAVANFIEYLRIPSVQPDIDYGKSTFSDKLVAILV